MSIDKSICCICNSKVSFEQISSKDAYAIHCPKCGYYHITGTVFVTSVSAIKKEDLFLFSGYLRINSSEENPIIITSEYLQKIPEIVLPFAKMSVSEKVNNILKYIYGSATKVLGRVDLTEDDIYRFFLMATGDLKTILDYLKEGQLIKYDKEKNVYICYFTIEGWKRYEQIQNEITNINSKQAFVAMSFDDSLKNIYTEAIKSAVEECGFDAIRVDSHEHNEKICDRIIAEINKSRFVIADFTQNKHGVYFEAGYALGLGIPVIWICKEQEVNNLHFDTRQYNHIAWKDTKDLKEKLSNRIRATIKNR